VIPHTYMILLTSESFTRRVPAWYVAELDDGVRACLPQGRVQAFVLTWEEILRAVRDPEASTQPSTP
jgi:hypothetical protein